MFRPGNRPVLNLDLPVGVRLDQRRRTLRLIRELNEATLDPEDHEFHARLSRFPRAGASVILRIGEQPFLLVSRGEWAWSRGPLQEQAIIAAARGATAMQVETRDMGGRRFADPYALDSAPTAIDAAAARCAGKIGRS